MRSRRPLRIANSRSTRSVLTTSVGLTASKVVANVAISVTAVVTARLLGPTDRGVLALEITVASFTMLLFTLGITMAARLHLVDNDNTMPLGEYLGLGILLTVVQGVACLASALLLLPLAHVVLSPAGTLALVFYGMAILEAQLLLNGLFAYGHFAQAAVCDIGAGLAGLGATLFLAGIGNTNVAPYVVALAIGPFGQIVVSLTLLERKGYRVRPRYAPLAWTRLLRTGVPGLGLTLGQSATYRLDRYIVGLYLTPAAVGLYSVAATVTEVARLPALSLGQVLFHRVATGRLALHKERMLYFTGLGLSAALIVALFLVAPWGVGAVFGHTYDGAVTPLRILLGGEITVASYLLDSSSLSGRNQMPKAAKATLIGLFSVTGLDILLIPRYGIVGAAWASVVGYSSMGLLVRYYLVRLMRSDAAERGPDHSARFRPPDTSDIPTGR